MSRSVHMASRSLGSGSQSNGVSNGRRYFAGFTLVELIVVISVLGLVVSLLLPAVQAARESSRLTHCKNNLKQIALAFLNHEQAHRHLPTGGWGWRWMGDPDRGFGREQPGGWVYNILPYIEQGDLRKRGTRQPDVIKRAEGKAVAETPLELFVCPSRRRALAYPFTHPDNFYNIDRPSVLGRTDYAACVGDRLPGLYGPGPASVQEGDNPKYIWTQLDRTGVVFRRSQIMLAHVRDGVSNTYMTGEAYLNPVHYFDGASGNNNQTLYAGYDRDTLRVTHPMHPPINDRAGLGSDHSFGSIHLKAFQMAFCDASIRSIPYSIGREIHRRLGNRKDGQPVPLH